MAGEDIIEATPGVADDPPAPVLGLWIPPLRVRKGDCDRAIGISLSKCLDNTNNLYRHVLTAQEHMHARIETNTLIHAHIRTLYMGRRPCGLGKTGWSPLAGWQGE